MLFKRRTKEGFLARVRNALWPRSGWRRAALYYKHRIIRIPASNHSIAAGLSIGAASSWNPLVGTHILQAALLCSLFRKNLIAGILGTAFGNPWTMPVLWVISYKIGNVLLDAAGYGTRGDTRHLSFDLQMLLDGQWSAIAPQILPVILGGYVMAMATFPLFYYPFYYMIKGARAARRTRIYKNTPNTAPQSAEKEGSGRD